MNDSWRTQPRAPRGSEDGGQWVEQLSDAIAASLRRPRDYRPVWWENVRVAGQEVDEVEREDHLFQMQGQYSRPELNDALADWQRETPIPTRLQAGLRSGSHRLGETTISDWVQEAGEWREKHRTVDLDLLADSLREAISQGRLTRDGELWRGVMMDQEMIDRHQPGAILTDRAFMATAMSREHAETMGDLSDGYGEPYLLRILAPEGTHVAPGASAVSELLLSDNTSYRVVSAEPPKPRNNPWTGEAEEGWGTAPGVITVELV